MTNKYSNFDGDNLDNYLGHKMIEIKENYVKSKLDIKDYHKQPMGLVHGGIYASLSETICSYGANLEATFFQNLVRGHVVVHSQAATTFLKQPD